MNNDTLVNILRIIAVILVAIIRTCLILFGFLLTIFLGGIKGASRAKMKSRSSD